MTPHFTAATDTTRTEVVEAFRRAWRRLAAPGASWTGAERVELAAIARAARSGRQPSESDLPPAAVEAARRIGAEPGSVSARWIDTEIEPAIGYARYVEIVGVVAQQTAVDTYHRAMGLPLEPLPEPGTGDPTGDLDETVRLRSSWVPTAGSGSVVYALSMVPRENRGFDDLHGPLYIPIHDMGDLRFSRSLLRPQIELVAARTSAINDCFY